MSQNNYSSSNNGNIVSPINESTATRLQGQEQDRINSDTARGENVTNTTMESGNGGALSDSDFPSMYTCPIVQEPPAQGATFLQHSSQVFEYSALYRHIATRGALRSMRTVRHPITNERIGRSVALEEVRNVSSQVQTILTRERVRRGLSPHDPNPISEEDVQTYNETIEAVENM